ncbi:ATP-binding protein [Leptospira ryugenii]|nr:ATP-binding protein [Leptospira ryugenii]
MLISTIDSFLPKGSSQSGTELFQSRLTVVILLMASVTAFATGLPIILVFKDPSGFVTLGYGVFIALLTVQTKFWLRPKYSYFILEIATGLHFLLCRSMQDRIDWPLAMWLTIFPILRLLYGGFRHGLWGIIYTTLLSFGMLALEFIQLFPQFPINEWISLERSVSFTVAVFVITSAFNALRLEAQKLADDAVKARSLFLANMSHELRTPMNGVLGITELLLAEELPSHLKNSLELVHRSGMQMVALINDILDLSRLESMKLEIEKVPTNVRNLLGDIISLLEPIAKQNQINLKLEIDETVPLQCLIDPVRLKQIITNLTNNAIKFTRFGSVTIRSFTKEEQLVIQVIDTGIGIPEDAMEKIFSPFQQADISFTRRFGGSGLGLTISQQLAMLMEGKITVKSELYVGSEFSLSLPCSTCSLVADSPKMQIQPYQTKSKPKVLLVEDNEVNQMVAQGMLKKCGCEVLTKSNGKEAIEAVLDSDFDFILMDCHMPVMDGFEASRQIRNLPLHKKQTPIIALTASALSEDVAACKRAGMDIVIAKPLTFQSLRSILEKLELEKL